MAAKILFVLMKKLLPNIFNTPARNTILAKGPTAVSPGLKNTFNQLCNWHEGDWAEYSIDVRTPGRYQVFLRHDSETVSNAHVRILCGESELLSSINNNQNVYCGDVQLFRGKTIFKLNIINANGLAIEKLVSIHLYKVDE